MTLPESERENLAYVGVETTTRDMMNAPEYLYNIYLTYDYERFATQIGLLYGEGRYPGGWSRGIEMAITCRTSMQLSLAHSI